MASTPPLVSRLSNPFRIPSQCAPSVLASLRNGARRDRFAHASHAVSSSAAAAWGRKLVTEITKADVEKLLALIAAGRARPKKVRPNNRARKLQGP